MPFSKTEDALVVCLIESCDVHLAQVFQKHRMIRRRFDGLKVILLGVFEIRSQISAQSYFVVIDRCCGNRSRMNVDYGGAACSRCKCCDAPLRGGSLWARG